jgi:hypothetical protein
MQDFQMTDVCEHEMDKSSSSHFSFCQNVNAIAGLKKTRTKER